MGAAMGAAMTGMRPVAEIMFSDFLACCWDYVANEIPKVRYMTGGQVTVPMVIRTANGGGLGFGAQHSQAVENWAMTVPGLKIAAPSTPADVVGLMAAAIRSDDPVLVFEHKGLFASKGAPAPPDHIVELGRAATVREGSDVTVVAQGVADAIQAGDRFLLCTDGLCGPAFRMAWRFRTESGEAVDVPVQGRVAISSALGVRKAALSGLGLALLPDWLVGEDLAAGTLVDVFPHHAVTATSFDTAAWLVYPSRAFIPGKVRAAIDFLRQHIGRPAGRERHDDGDGSGGKGLRPGAVRHGRDRSSAGCQTQECTARKSHGDPL
jgi:hypothetical protein